MLSKLRFQLLRFYKQSSSHLSLLTTSSLDIVGDVWHVSCKLLGTVTHRFRSRELFHSEAANNSRAEVAPAPLSSPPNNSTYSSTTLRDL